MCHEVVAAAGVGLLPGDVASDAFAVLLRHDDVGHRDIDAAGAGWRDLMGEAASGLAQAALQVDHPRAEAMVLELVATSTASLTLLETWDDPRGAGAIRDLFLSGPRATGAAAYVRARGGSGEASADILLELAEDVRAQEDDYRDRRMSAVLRELADLQAPRPVGTFELLVDLELPLWLRGELARGNKAFPDRMRALLADSEAVEKVGAAVVLRLAREWGPAADAVLAQLGEETVDGFTARERLDRRWSARDLDQMSDDEADVLRADLTDPDSAEPDLAVTLEMLLSTGPLRVEDVAPLRNGWRARLLRKPDPYCGARPAVISFATALLRAEDPLGDAVARVVAADKRAWSANHKALVDCVLGELGDDVALARVADAGCESGAGAIGHVMAVTRRTGEAATVVAGQLWRTAPDVPRYRTLHYGRAAIAVQRNPQQPDWYIRKSRTGEPDYRDSARVLAQDRRLPRDMRRWLRQEAES